MGGRDSVFKRAEKALADGD